MDKKANIINERLQYFNGSEVFYQIPLLRTRFTDGIKYLADAAECFWLVTDSSVVAKSLRDRSSWVTIDFKRLPKDKREASGYEAEIIYSDGNDNVLERHGYNVTDFPLDELRLFFVNDTLMLPSEY
ncbi:DUF6876 family protein [Flavisericum labens]|uniref:DUF6876 family protein n=1 Tax=Flavisericum labens TaxID=3377112 RepID=UPI00387AA43D